MSLRAPAAALAALLLAAAAARAAEPCRIDVVEEGSGWPVPLVELRTTHNVRFVSDNAGVIAFDLPELMGVETWFHVKGHGYGVDPDGFGYEGVRLTPVPGGRLAVKVKRRLPGKRLGRITGAGIFGESQTLGLEPAWTEQGVLGCDSVQLAAHGERLFWIWGDTNLPGYPLGLFHALGATTALRPLKSFEPPVRLRYTYVRNESGRPRNVCEMNGKGPTWLSGLASLPDRNGKRRLVGTFVKVKAPLAVSACGLCVWDEGEETFALHKMLWTRAQEGEKPPPVPEGHPVLWTDPDGKPWILFGDPFPRLRCAPTFEAWSDPSAWEVLEPQKAVPSAGGGEIAPHRGSIAWSAYRKRWVAVFTQAFGASSVIGELWYAESPSPTGPWGKAVKVVTHDNYSFYNPLLHPELTPPDSAVLLFEATYTAAFADRPQVTPRHDYNQVLYRLDLDDSALIPD